MQCDKACELIGPAQDGELAGEDVRALKAHLEACPSCAAQASDLARIRQQLREAGRERAPAGLAVLVRSALADAAQENATADGLPVHPIKINAEPRTFASRWTASLLARAAGIVLVCGLSALFAALVTRGQMQDARLTQDVATAHIRSLLQETQVQIASSDQHTVKPWFTGRVEFVPNIKDLSADGFPLVGGRLDYIGERRVSAAVYRRRQHVITVFMWPTDGSEQQDMRIVAHKGYSIVSWARAGLAYSAVSDLNSGELRQLQSLL